jgi:hypothetical protein
MLPGFPQPVGNSSGYPRFVRKEVKAYRDEMLRARREKGA